MMNIPPGDVQTMSLWEYEALLYHWNEAHGGSESGDPPDAKTAMKVLDLINANPALTH